MNLKQKKFSIYVFLSTLSRSLIEVYIPVILYKYGYSIKEVILYYLLVNVVSLILAYPCIYISKKYDNKVLVVLGMISFLLTQIYLNFINYSISYIIVIASLYALYRRSYWVSRRFYNLMVIKKDNISSTYSKISIINELGVAFSTYLGAIFLDYVNTNTLTVIAMILFILSSIPIFTLKLNKDEEKEKEKLSLFNTLKKTKISNVLHFGIYELINVVKFLIPLYLFIYVKNTYQTIGLVTVISDLSLIIFTYIFGKKLDHTHKNFLSISIILFILITVLKVNTLGIYLLLVSLIEGIIKKMYELSISNQFYMYSKNFEYHNYNLVYEVSQNLFRVIVMLVLYFFVSDIKIMVYTTLGFMLLGVFLKFKQVEK